MACLLVTLRCIHQSLTLILHVLELVSSVFSLLPYFFKFTMQNIMFTHFMLILFISGSQVLPSSMPPPRLLPQRPWAASIPTILTHNALHVLLLPSPTPCLVPGLAGSYLCSPLERFLGSVIMRRHLQRIIQQEPNVSVKQIMIKIRIFFLITVFVSYLL